jgi:hypothetical protein
VTSAEAAAAAARERGFEAWLLVWAPPSERKLERGKDQVLFSSSSFIGLHGPGRARLSALEPKIFSPILFRKKIVSNLGILLKKLLMDQFLRVCLMHELIAT